jgi:hypothetical protein
MSLFVMFIINVALFVTAELLRPKPEIEDAQATAFEDANFPSIDPSAKIPVFVGNERNGSPHVMNVTEYNTIEIREKVKTGMFSSQNVVRGHRYLVGMALGLGVGPLTLRRIMYDDDEIWSGTAAANDDGIAIDINLPEHLGGLKNGGGLVGRLRFFAGSATQNQAAYLAPFEPEGIAYRHTAYIVLENFEVGETPNLKPFSFEVERYPNPLGLSGAINQNGKDVSMMTIAAEVFVNDDWGFGLDVSSLTGFDTAATTLDTELNFGTMKLFRETKLQDILGNVSKQVDGQHRFRADLGLWEYKLNRDDYTIGALPVFEQGGEVKAAKNFKRATYEDLTNLVEIAYSNRVTKHKPSPAIAHDGSLYDRLGGRNNPARQRYPFVYDEALAQKIASRVLNKAAFAFAAVDLVVDRNAYDLLPGDVVNWKWPDLGIDQLPMRIMKISLGNPDNPEITFSCVQDIFGQTAALFSNPPASSYTPVAGAPVAITSRHGLDQPYFMALQDADRVDDVAVEPATEKPMVMAEKPQGNALNYDLTARLTGSGEPYLGESDANSYCPSGTLQDVIAESAGDTIASVVVLNVSDVAKLTEFTSATKNEIQQTGENLVMFVPASGEPEFLAYESLSINGTTVTMTNCHRALVDTLENTYAIGDRVWFIGAQGLATTLSEYGDTQGVDIQITNRATTGASTALSFSVTMRNRVSRPYPPGFLRIEALRWPSATFAADSDFNITWRHRDRTTDVLKYQDDTSEAALESGFEYMLEIYDDITDGLLRRIRPTGSGNTPAGDDVFDFDNTTGSGYDYVLADQINDGGPVPRMRAELSVQESVTGAAAVTTLLDTIRVFSVVIPINFLERGPTYELIQSKNPKLHYPLQEESGALISVGSRLETLTINGTIGYHVPGPMKETYAIHIPEGTANYLSIADGINADWGVALCWSFWVRMGEVDGVNNCPLIYRGDTIDTDMDLNFDYKLFVNTSGKLQFEWNDASFPRSVAAWESNWRIDDGEWHHVAIMDGNPFMILVDGTTHAVSAGGGTFDNSGTRQVNFFGGPDTSLSSPACDVAHMAMWEDESAAPGSHAAISAPKEGKQYYGMHFAEYMKQRSPFAKAMLSLDPVFYIEPGYRMGNNASVEAIPDLTAHIFGNSWVGTESPEFQGTVTTPATQLKQAGPYIGQRSFSADLSTDALRVDMGTLNTSTIIGVPGHYMDRSDGSFTFICWIRLPAGGATRREVLLNMTSTDAGAQRRYQVNVEADEKIEVWASVNASSGSRTDGYFEKTDAAVLIAEEWQMIAVTKLEGAANEAEIFINGTKVASTATYSGIHASPDEAVWLDTVAVDTRMTVYGPPYSPGGAEADYFTGDVAGAAYVNRKVADADIARIYAAAMSPDQSLRDVMLRDNPEHFIYFDDNAAVDEITGLGAPTATGTFASGNGQLQIEADGEPNHAARITPLGFRGGERLAYGTPILQSLEDGSEDLDTWSLTWVMRPLELAATSVIWGNAEAGEAATGQNLTTSIVTGTNDLRHPYPTPTTPTQLEFAVLGEGKAIMATGREDEANVTKSRTLWQDGVELGSFSADQNYTGGAITRFLVGDRGSSISLPWTGDLAYLNAYARVVDDRIIARQALKYRGLSRYEIEVLQYPGIDAMYLLHENLVEINAAAYSSVHDAVQDLSFSANNPQKSSAPTGSLMAGGMNFIKANSEDASSVADPGVSFPIIMGGWFRTTDNAEDAFIALSNNGVSSSYLAVGIFTDNAGASISGTLRTSGAVAFEEWAHIVVVWDAANDKRIYLNGALQTTDTNSDTIPVAFTTQSVNSIDGSGGKTFGSGDYAGVFFGNESPTDADVMEIYSASIPNGPESMARRDGATFFYPLDEYLDAQLTFQDALDRSNIATGTGLTQGVIGIVPQRPSLCVDLDGTNDIDCVRTDYAAGTTNRGFSAWLEVGFTGTVVSMGANTDANALVISVDGSGDVSIHIRGTGNERIWTTALDVGTAGTGHWLHVQLVGDSLHDFEVYIDGVLETTIGTAGTDTVLATTATLAFTIGSDVTDIGKADGNGKIQAVAHYPAGLTATRVLEQFTVMNAA